MVAFCGTENGHNIGTKTVQLFSIENGLIFSDKNGPIFDNRNGPILWYRKRSHFGTVPFFSIEKHPNLCVKDGPIF